MSGKSVVIQIFTGGFTRHLQNNMVSYEAVAARLEPLLPVLPIKKVIMGWCINDTLYQKTKALLDPYGIELYLWLPVFSETGLLKDSVTLTDYLGKPVSSYQLKADENFEFYCPNNPINKKNLLDIYFNYFNNCGFNGVFLDKIRYASFGNGLSGGFSCFCPYCIEKYNQHGFDIKTIFEQMEKIAAGDPAYTATPFGMLGYHEGNFRFSNPIWQQFFALKQLFISEAIEELAAVFHGDNIKIGMDTFAPYLAPLVGQNLQRLSSVADFLKPMMYRITQAPAGLPFEYQALVNETAPHMRCEELHVLDDSFIKSELHYIAGLDAPIYAGIEINRIEPIALVTPEYIHHNLTLMSETTIEGFVLSWDLLSAPQENIKEAIRFFERG